MFFVETSTSEIDTAEIERAAVAWLNSRRRIASSNTVAKSCAVAPKTLARRITSMRTLGKALGITILAEYTAPTPAPTTPHPLPGLEADVARLIAASNTNQQRALIALCALCGCRIGEALSLRPQDFNLNDMMLTIRGKGDKTRIIPISPTAWRYMVECVAEATLNQAPTVLTYTDRHARDLITRIGQRAGIRRAVASHDLRATFATVTYNNSGGDIRAVQILLGHADVKQTQAYTGVQLTQLRKAIDFEVKA